MDLYTQVSHCSQTLTPFSAAIWQILQVLAEVHLLYQGRKAGEEKKEKGKK